MKIFQTISGLTRRKTSFKNELFVRVLELICMQSAHERIKIKIKYDKRLKFEFKLFSRKSKYI